LTATAPTPRSPDGRRPVGGVASSSALLLLAQIVGNTGLFTSVLLIARQFGPTQRGTFAFLMVSAMVLGRVSTFGIDEATTVFAAQRPRLRPVLIANLLLFAGVVSVVVGCLAAGALLALDEVRPPGVDAPKVLVVAAGTVASAFLAGGFALLIGSSRFRQQALATAVAPWIYVGMLLVLWKTVGLSVLYTGLLWAASIMLWALMLLWGAARGVGIARPNIRLLRISLGFGLRAWGGSIFRFLNFRTDQLLMGFISTEAALGIYAVAVNASEVLLYLPTATATALLPVISSSERAAGAIRTLTIFRTLIMLTAVSLAVSALAGPFLLPIVFGEAFRGAVEPFLLLMPGALGFAALIVFSNALVATSSPGRATIGPFVSFVTGTALDFALIPRYGASGAGAAASAAFVTGGVVALLVYRERTGYDWRLLIPTSRDVKRLGDVRQFWQREFDWADLELGGAARPSERAPKQLTYSVVIPTKDRPLQAVAAVERVLAQSRPPDRVIVVDASTPALELPDDLVSRAGALGVDLIAAHTPPSTAGQRNYGARLVSSPLVLFLDDDVEIGPEYIATLLRPWERAGVDAYGGVVGSHQYEGHRFMTRMFRRLFMLHYFERGTSRATTFRASRKVRYVGVPSRAAYIPAVGAGAVAFRTDLVLRHPFNERFPGYALGEDLEMSYRLSRDAPILQLPDVQYYHREHPGERTSSLRWYFRGRREMYFRLLHLERGHGSRVAFAVSVIGETLAAIVDSIAERDLAHLRWFVRGARATVHEIRSGERVDDADPPELRA
jgi:O-antigen/teichoic acid export membrane protein/GT2 family glycosyltransferase